jgi:hypothetical protein
MPRPEVVEQRGPFRIYSVGRARQLACARCVPGGIADLLNVIVEEPDAGTEQYFADVMEQHLAEAHPPTIPGRLADVRPGWRDLLMDLHARLIEIDPGYEIDGLADEAASLRVAMRGDQSREVEALLDAAATESRQICVFCGWRPARPTPGFVSGTLMCCEAHGWRSGCITEPEYRSAP